MTVRKTAVNENNLMTLAEYKIWSPRKLTRLESVTVAYSMHHPPNYKLGFGVLAGDAAHAFAALGRAQGVAHPTTVRASVLRSVLAVTP